MRVPSEITELSTGKSQLVAARCEAVRLRYGRVKRDASRKVRPARQCLDNSGLNREIDRCQDKLGGVEAVPLVGKKHFLCALSDETHAGFVHGGGEVRDRREPGQPQCGHRRVVRAACGHLLLNRGCTLCQLVGCHVCSSS